MFLRKRNNYDLKELPKITWSDAISYGSDKPDLRNPLKLVEVKKLFQKEEFKVFSDPANLMKAELLWLFLMQKI